MPDELVNHHRAAEDSLQEAADAEWGDDRERYELGCAQVHAILALDQTLGKFLAKLEALDAE